ncbi:DUF3168 domain-containing protein [Prosthecomicrobium pneumaticum]|uniref:Gene transfer agent protein n=1 Tax=Prosthecomicrobium pneumaticum TaxID=81895 RepID=A0A7W9L464_9HYPH|nr:DUF3168 domain-containing protein [Prosthecomicrobium pneumaticum]MBB5755285.1 hypothetical protein [Prosthecomicrobium pneumaticum]
MSGAPIALQAAVLAALAADADLLADLGEARIYDAAPRDATFPFVALGAASAEDWSSGTEAGTAHRLVLHVWSRAGGRREAWRIAGHLMRILHDAPLALESARAVLVRVDFAEVRRDPDGITTQGIVRLSALTEAE